MKLRNVLSALFYGLTLLCPFAGNALNWKVNEAEKSYSTYDAEAHYTDNYDEHYYIQLCYDVKYGPNIYIWEKYCNFDKYGWGTRSGRLFEIPTVITLANGKTYNITIGVSTTTDFIDIMRLSFEMNSLYEIRSNGQIISPMDFIRDLCESDIKSVSPDRYPLNEIGHGSAKLFTDLCKAINTAMRKNNEPAPFVLSTKNNSATGRGSTNSLATQSVSDKTSGQKAQKESFYFHVSGVVTDQYGKPLEGIMVWASGGGFYPVYTDSNGCFTLHYTHEGAVFNACPRGELTKRREFTITRENRTKGPVIKLNL